MSTTAERVREALRELGVAPPRRLTDTLPWQARALEERGRRLTQLEETARWLTPTDLFTVLVLVNALTEDRSYAPAEVVD